MSDPNRHTCLITENFEMERPKSQQSIAPRSTSVKEHQEERWGKVVPVRIGSPGKHYTSRYALKFGYSFTVATSTASRLPLMIRPITSPSTAEQLELLRHLRHPNVVESLELYTCPQEGYFLVSECLPTTLWHLYAAPIYPTEPQLSSILHQVLTGIDFLLARGLVYEQVSAANLLMSPAGDVKICDIECCSPGSDVSKLLESFTVLMMKLMDKEKAGNEVADLTHPDRWSLEAIDLFAKARTKSPVEELLGHPFMRKREQRDLVWLVQFVQIRARHTSE